MAIGYRLRTPTQNGGIRRGVTVANPMSRRHYGRRGHGVSILPLATGRERSSASWESNPSGVRRTRKRRSGQARTGRVVVRKAGRSARRTTSARRTVTGRYVTRRSSTRAVRNPGRRYTRRSRPQSRTTARAVGHVKKTRKTKKRAAKRMRVRKPGGGYYLRKRSAKRRVAKRTTRRYAPKHRVVRRTRTARRTTRHGRLVRNAIPRWTTDVHPETRKAGVRGQKMTKAERAKWTKRGQSRGALQTAVKTYWKVDVHPGTGQPGIRGRQMTAAERQKWTSHGVLRSSVRGVKKVRGVTMTKKRTRKARKTGRKVTRRTGTRRYRVRTRSGKTYLRRYPRRTRKTARKVTRRTGVRRYRVKASRGRKSYMRRYPKKTRRVRRTRKVAHRTARARRYVYRKAGKYRARRGRKTYMRRYPRRTRKTARRVARRTGVRRYRVKASRGRKSYMRRYPKKTRRVRKTRKVARRAGVRRYRVKASRGRKSYTRRYPRRARKSAKRALAVRKTGRYRVKRRGGGTYLRRYPKHARRTRRYGRKYARRGARRYTRRYARRVTVRVPAKRSRSGRIVRRGYSYTRKARMARNPYKRSRVRVGSYRRSQWYPHRKRGGSRWISQSQAKSLNLLTKREMRALARRHPGMLANPGSALAALPSIDQLKGVGLMVGEGLVGFGGAVAVGQALAAMPQVAQYTGTWTPVLGNLAAGLGFWALCHFMPDNMKLQEAKPYVMVGVGLAAAVNALRNLISGGTIPSSVGSWVLPGGQVPVSLTTQVAEAGAAGLGQIDIYEAALNGVSGIEEELEMELDRMGGMGGGDGIFGDANEGIFSGLDGTGTPVREAYAGMGEYIRTPMGGVNVQEAFSGGVGEYFKSPVGEYLETPMGSAMVEQAYAGMGEYFKVPMGAMVEEAFSGMGFSPEQVGGSSSQALMPGFRAAVQKLVRDRIASGQPMDDAFYTKLGQAAASLARKKFDQRMVQASGQVQDIDVQAWKSPVTRQSVPNFRSPITDPALTPGEAEEIEDYEGKGEDEGIFSGGEDEGIF